MRVVLLGAPGSGKGTQAKAMADHGSVPHISTGDIFREEMTKKTDLGLRVEEYVKAGRLVPDEMTTEIVCGRLAKPDVEKGFILDGYPRTVGQAEALDAYLSSAKRPLDGVLYLKVSEGEIFRRLSSRKRDDDTPETIKKRITVFNDLTEPLVAYYHGLGLLSTIEGEGSIESVSQAVRAALDGLKK